MPAPLGSTGNRIVRVRRRRPRKPPRRVLAALAAGVLAGVLILSVAHVLSHLI